MIFKSRYGEPRRLEQPHMFEPGGSGIRDTYAFDLSDNNSYEENRLMFETQVAESQEEAAMTIPDTTSSFANSYESIRLQSTLRPRRAIFLKWSQSERIRVLVGPNETPFAIPVDFLTKRSPFFQTMLSNACRETDTKVVRLVETTTSAFKHIAVWLMSTEPKLEPGLDALTLVDIATFATVYILPALRHQALDCLRSQIQSGAPFVVSHEFARRIYNRVDADSQLRQLAKAALAALKPGWASGAFVDGGIQEWMRVIGDCPDLASDYFKIMASGCNPSDLAAGGACQFHDHAAGANFSLTSRGNKRCSKVEEECFETIELK